MAQSDRKDPRELLKAARERAGKTQRELAVAMDIPESGYYRIEILQRHLRFEEALRACRFLDIPINSLDPEEDASTQAA